MVGVKFTPEVLAEFPRRGSAIPNADGSYLLYTVSHYSIETNQETKETKYIDLKTNEHHFFSDDPDLTSAQWLYGSSVIWQKAVDGKTRLFVSDVGSSEKKTHLIGVIDAPIADFSTTNISSTNDRVIAIVFSAPVKSDGSLLNPENEPKPKTTAKEYDGVRTRYWNSYIESYRNSLFYTTVRFDDQSKKYKLRDGPPVNALKGTRFEFPWVVTPFGTGGSVSVSKSGILFTAIDPTEEINKQWVTHMWYIPLKTYEESPTPEPIIIDKHLTKCAGSVITMAFSSGGGRFAFMKAVEPKDGGLASRSILFFGNTSAPQEVKEITLLDPKDEQQQWDRWPESLLWSSDGKTLFSLVSDNARRPVFTIDLSNISRERIVPKQITQGGAVAAIYRLSELPADASKVVVSTSSLIDSSLFFVLDNGKHLTTFQSSLTEYGALFGASKEQLSEFYVTNSKGSKIHSWLITPPGFKSSSNNEKKYPVALIIHGGPSAAWFDQWSHRWVPILYAAQGYVVVIPNFTGSNAFGEKFLDIEGVWGTQPYEDIVKSFEYVKNNIDFADTSRTICSGASFGGYMSNFIAGQPLAKEIKAFVVHSGISSLRGMFATGEGFSFGLAEFGCYWWEKKEEWDKNDPLNLVQNWSKPMLFSHAESDYVCPVDQGIIPYNICLARGIPTRFLTFPNESHFIMNRANQLHWYRTIFGWINKYADNELEGNVKLAPALNEPVRTDV